MTRQRNKAAKSGQGTSPNPTLGTNGANSNQSSSSSTGGNNKSRPAINKPDDGKKSLVIMSKWRIVFGCICLAIASYFGYLGYLETRVNTPFDDQKMVQRGGNSDPGQYWGSFRPGTYFGMKTRDPYSLVMGLMWYFPSKLGPGGKGIRHWCEIDDRLGKYGWIRHDGKTFGVQEIKDGNIDIESSFVKFPGGQFGGDWTARVTISGDPNEEVSLIWYTAFDEKTGGYMNPTLEDAIVGIRGETPGLGEFQLRLHASNGTIINQSYLSTVAESLKQLTDSVKMNLRLLGDKQLNRNFIVLAGEMLRNQNGEILEPNFIATQITVKPPFTFDIAFNSLSELSEELSLPSIGPEYTSILSNKVAEFDQRFESLFHIREKGYSNEEIEFAKATFSNLIGGIGYFYGSSRVLSKYTKEPVHYWRAPLYTAVPSRSFFPRGFLWDEGFHGLMISHWDLDIQLDILNHWFDLMNIEGWIPREQILGVEALAKVPEEFVTQRNSNANPPTFFILLRRILSKSGSELKTKNRLQNLDRLFPRLQAWFSWFNNTQKGDVPGTYRWRGRDENTVRELNPKTLSSGLDDYPRASHPNDKERHIDLRCWIAYAAGVMADLARLLNQDDSKYLETYLYLSDNSLLNELHLSPYTETYSDYGLHTDSVTLKRPQIKTSPHQTHVMPQNQEMIRVTLKNPELRFVDSTFGYGSLFPFLLEILTPDSPYLGKLLTNLRDPNRLWTDFGIRSLSKLSPLYMKRNTEHDPPYWRGQIWMNINYLTLKALHHYGSQPGPYSDQAKKIYVELRNNVVSNIIREYNRTGFVWEQYNDKTGHGSGCYPFTGWTSLIVLIMAESY